MGGEGGISGCSQEGWQRRAACQIWQQEAAGDLEKTGARSAPRWSVAQPLFPWLMFHRVETLSPKMMVLGGGTFGR